MCINRTVTQLGSEGDSEEMLRKQDMKTSEEEDTNLVVFLIKASLSCQQV